MEKENKILEILDLVQDKVLSPDEALPKILLLFSVSGQSEQLKAVDELFDYAWNLAQYPEEQAKLNEIRERF